MNKIKLDLRDNIRESKVHEVDDKGVEHELKNICAVRVNIDVRKPEKLKVILETQVEGVLLESNQWRMVALSKHGQLKEVKKIVFVDGTEDVYVK